MSHMARKTVKTIRLDREATPCDAGRRRPPKTRLFVCTDPHLGEESELFKDFRD